MLLGLTAVLPDGEILRCRAVPRSAAGPDLRRLLIGSEGTLAVVTEATLACRARPDGWEWLAFGFPDFTTMAEALRDVKRAETGAAVLRGYDETDAQLGFGALNHTTGCVALAGFPAGPPGLDARKQAAAAILQTNGTELAARYGEHWWQHRNDAVQTFAQIMGPERTFGTGVIVDTMEVAGLWSAVPRLYESIRAALSAHAQAVACHLSHLYPSGSSLYFTFLIGAADDREAETTYRAAWQQAAKLYRSRRHDHPPSRRRAPQGTVPHPGPRRDRSTRAHQDQESPRPGRDHEPGRIASMTSPFGPLVLIANPNAGRGTVSKALPRVESVLRNKNLAYRIVRTTHPGHATEAARQALSDGERYLVAVGGDGTVHEVVNGMVRDGGPVAADAVLGVVAAGSGCDFVRSFGLPPDAEQAAERLTGDRVRTIDVGTVTCAGRHQTRCFVNIAEAGLGGAVVARAANLGKAPRRRPVRGRVLADAAALPPGRGPARRQRPVPRLARVQRGRGELPVLRRRHADLAELRPR